MTDTKFTKGPWLADTRGGCCAVYEASRADDTNGCHSDDDRNIYYSNRDAKYNGLHWEMSEEATANAHLIAAAPEMFGVIKELISELDYENNSEYEYKLVKKAKEILIKARGE